MGAFHCCRPAARVSVHALTASVVVATHVGAVATHAVMAAAILGHLGSCLQMVERTVTEVVWSAPDRVFASSTLSFPRPGARQVLLFHKTQ